MRNQSASKVTLQAARAVFILGIV
ncbi:MAG: hypothetical protein K0S42_2432, partial [Microvirga sp.]|nr:hypothetical protein [Microvirga sp.]